MEQGARHARRRLGPPVVIVRGRPGELVALALDGERIDPARAAFLPLERGLLYGDGLFETMAVELGAAAGTDLHYARLAASAETLGLPVPARAAWERGLQAALGARGHERPGASACAVRVTWTRGASRVRGFPPPESVGPPRLLVAAYAAAQGGEEALAEGCSAGIVRGLVPGDLARHKTLSAMAYVVAAARAQARGLDEALLVDEHDRLLEAAGSNVFVHTPGVGLRTPPLARPILPGITRAQVLRWLPEAREADVTVRELLEADEIFLTNAVRGVVPVDSIEDRVLPRADGASHTHDAQKAFLAWQYESCLAAAEAAHRPR